VVVGSKVELLPEFQVLVEFAVNVLEEAVRDCMVVAAAAAAAVVVVVAVVPDTAGVDLSAALKPSRPRAVLRW